MHRTRANKTANQEWRDVGQVVCGTSLDCSDNVMCMLHVVVRVRLGVLVLRYVLRTDWRN